MTGLTARTASDLAYAKVRRAFGADVPPQDELTDRVIETLGTMKAAAMKIGQQLAMDPDLLTPEQRARVAQLFSQAPAMPYEQIAEVLREELGDAPDVVFAEFERTPMAAASLGQVHRARLHDGTEVAVKVQYPGVAEALVNDLRNAGLLVRALKSPGRAVTKIDPKPYYEEIQREIGGEADYVREARQAEDFAQAVAHLPELHVPRVFPAHSSKRVLVMEYVRGATLKDFAESDASPQERWRVGRQLAVSIFAPFLAHGLMHGDPHPGNFLVRADGRLTLLDFGAVKRFTPEFVRGFYGLMRGSLDGRDPDFAALLGPAGFRFHGDYARAKALLLEIHEIASRPVAGPEYDWAACTMVSDIRRLFHHRWRDVLGVEPPAQSVLFYRAVAGMANNLRLLGTRGPYRDVAAEIWNAGAPRAA